MPNSVVVTITNKIVGQGSVVPYNHTDGLQFYPETPGARPEVVRYRVPIYEIRVEGAGTYKAIRFAVRNTGQVPPQRGCDTGLSHSRTCTPSWVPRYSPHSFSGSARPGAWRLIPGQGFLIHEGADSRLGEVGGSLGCIEVVDGGWNGFLADIERLAGVSCEAVARNRKLTVKIQPAPYPAAILLTRIGGSGR